VVAELGGGLFPRSHPRPNRHSSRDRFEIEKPKFPIERLECLRETPLDDETTFFRRTDLSLGGERQLFRGGDVLDRVDPGIHIARGGFRTDEIELGDMIRRLRPAPLHERTIAGLGAMHSDRDVRQRAAQHLELRLDFPGNRRQHVPHRGGHVTPNEQIALVWKAELFVEVHDVHGVDVNAAPA
jgi:hypothetical protein